LTGIARKPPSPEVRMYGRNGQDWTKQVGYVVPALAQLTKRTAQLGCAQSLPPRIKRTPSDA
jgi:hypothetical protein